MFYYAAILRPHCRSQPSVDPSVRPFLTRSYAEKKKNGIEKRFSGYVNVFLCHSNYNWYNN